MIFIILIILIIAFFIVWNYFRNPKISMPLGITLAVLIVVTLGGMIANYHNHWGMKQQTESDTHQIYSVNKEVPLILYKKIGTTGAQAVIYKRDINQKKPKVSRVEDTKNVVKKGAPENTVDMTTTNWVYKNNFYKLLFAGTPAKQFIRQKNVYNITNKTLMLTPEQAKAFAAAVKQQTAALKAQAKPNVKIPKQMQMQMKQQIAKRALQEALKH